ncbi:uncharacterized protein LOC124494491 [Dermatophagoides farinae]|uniref:uncharacterized protein LOC124494491 n=1 Tax=Dermatophagoides farinae TaxID=6954 RepID=UPI003F5EC3B8
MVVVESLSSSKSSKSTPKLFEQKMCIIKFYYHVSLNDELIQRTTFTIKTIGKLAFVTIISSLCFKNKIIKKENKKFEEQLKNKKSSVEITKLKKEITQLKQRVSVQQSKMNSSSLSHYNRYKQLQQLSNPGRVINESEDAILYKLEKNYNISLDIFKSLNFPFAEAREYERNMILKNLTRTKEKRNKIVYFLMDPSMIKDISSQENIILGQELIDYRLFYQFISSIFYVGQGKKNRPPKHLFYANKEITQPTKLDLDPKFRKIRKIWDRGLNPILFNAYEGLTQQEAQAREALLIETIGLYKLTNQVYATYRERWKISINKKRILGTYLLCKIFKKYSSEEELWKKAAKLEIASKNACEDDTEDESD